MSIESEFTFLLKYSILSISNNSKPVEAIALTEYTVANTPLLDNNAKIGAIINKIITKHEYFLYLKRIINFRFY